MSKMNIRFSIIIPVYNVEPYLAECVNSVLQQDCENFEIIMVDDGSTDKSGVICDEFAEKNKKIRVIHKKNGGLSDARNVGLNEANGEYVIFLDSDDYWINTSFLTSVEQEIIKSQPDIVIYGYQKKYCGRKNKDYIPYVRVNSVIQLVKNNEFNICAWDKVIKKQILLENAITFRENVFSEDMEWCALLYKFANSCAVICNAEYAYRQRENSISKRITPKNITDIYNNYNYCLELRKSMSEEKKMYYDYYLSKNLSMFIIVLSLLDDLQQREYIHFIFDNLNVLKYSSRNREKIIYLLIKLVGVNNTLRLIKRAYK